MADEDKKDWVIEQLKVLQFEWKQSLGNALKSQTLHLGMIPKFLQFVSKQSSCSANIILTLNRGVT